jgi:hypothetical protein
MKKILLILVIVSILLLEVGGYPQRKVHPGQRYSQRYRNSPEMSIEGRANQEEGEVQT